MGVSQRGDEAHAPTAVGTDAHVELEDAVQQDGPGSRRHEVYEGGDPAELPQHVAPITVAGCLEGGASLGARQSANDEVGVPQDVGVGLVAAEPGDWQGRGGGQQLRHRGLSWEREAIVWLDLEEVDR